MAVVIACCDGICNRKTGLTLLDRVWLERLISHYNRILVLRIDPLPCIVQITSLFIEHLINFTFKFLYFLTRRLLLLLLLELAKELTVLVEVVRHGIVRQFLQLLLHDQVSIDLDLEPPLHLLVIDLVFLADELLLVQVDDIGALGRDVHFESFRDSVLNQFHFFHHEGFLALTALHVGDSHLFDAVENFLLGGLVDLVHNLELGPLSDRTLPLRDIGRIKSFIVVDEVSKIVSSNRHYDLILFLILLSQPKQEI